MKRKKLLSLSLAAVMCLSAAAAGAGSLSVGNCDPMEAAPVVLTLSDEEHALSSGNTNSIGEEIRFTSTDTDYLTSFSSGNIGRQAYDRWTEPINSYLLPLGNGNLMRVEAPETTGYLNDGNYDKFDFRYRVEYYDSNYNLTNSLRLDEELPIFGGFCSTQSNYFLVTGQNNSQEDDSREVIRITKYDKSWNRLGATSLRAADTCTPFLSGSLRIQEYNNILYIRTAHEMYDHGDGKHHQSSFTIMYNIQTGAVDKYLLNQSDPFGYASHSFNQFIKRDGSSMIVLDHGDAYPRSVELRKTSIPAFGAYSGFQISTSDVICIPGTLGDNSTGVTVGGLEISDSSYLVAGTTVNDLNSYTDSSARNVFVAVVAKDLSTTTMYKYTSFTSDNTGAGTPHLVKLSDNRFLLMYQTSKEKVSYIELDGKGKQVGGTHELFGALSDCVPVVNGQKLVWYTWLNYGVTFYEIDINNLDSTSSLLIYNGEKYVSKREEETQSPTESGLIGPAAFYELYPSGNLYIFGWGDINTTNIFSNDSRIEHVYIEPLITSLPALFTGCSELKSVNLADTITSISGSPFMNCSKLTSVNIPKGISVINSVFSGCTGLTTIEIPSSVTTIGYCAFSGCTGLTSITLPESVTAIGSSAFYGCTALKNVNLPSKLEVIGSNAFNGCTSLTSFTIPSSVESIQSQAFYGCKNLSTINIPNTVKSLGSYVFYDCSSLISLSIPDSVKTIGTGAFFNCTSLRSITLPSKLNVLGDYVFAMCIALESINIPATVTKIGNDTFYGCSSLTSLVIPDSVTSIGEYAFYWCAYATDIKLSDNLQSIGPHAFHSCTRLRTITIPPSVTSIGESAFNSCTNLSSLIMSNSVETIGSYVFDYCNNLYDIFYSGTEQEWNAMLTDSSGNNVDIRLSEKTTIHYNYSTTPLDLTVTPGNTTIAKGGSITITAAGEGGTSPYEYAFAAQAPNGTWYTLKDYSTSASYTFKPASVGYYTVRVKVRDKNNSEQTKDFILAVSSLANNSKISATTITKGQSIKLTAAASGGTSPYSFAYVAKAPDGKWYVLKNYSTAATHTWTPASTGKYTVQVKVKDNKNAVIVKSFDLTVTTLANNSKISANTITKGQSIKLTAAASGGTSPYKYAYVAQAPDDKWYVLKNYSTSTTHTWTPASTGKYTVQVKVKDSKNAVIVKSFNLTVKS